MLCFMRLSKLIYIVLLFVGTVEHWGCKKEYSYEGGDVPINDTSIITDSVAMPPKDTTISCHLCNEADSLTIGSWRFRNNQSLFCGTTTDAGFISESTFTFFGPSACSQDSGMVITVYLPITFTEDKFQTTSSDVAFYYYDHKSTTDLFIKLPPLPFSVLIESYTHLTGIAIGTFQGVVYKRNGDTTTITDGKFKVRLK